MIEIFDFIKENKLVHFIIFILSGVLLALPDWIIVNLVGDPISPKWKFTFLIFLIVSTPLVISDILTGKWKQKEYSKEYKELKKEFTDKELIKKIMKVCNWKKKFPENGEYVKQYNDPTNYPKLQQMHNERREIIEYYQKVQQYSKNYLISEEEAKLLIPKNRKYILIKIFEPIEKDIKKITGETPDLSIFRFCEDIYK